MKIFLDTSSLIKLYHEEIGSEYLDSLFENQNIAEIFLSEISKVEYKSAIFKKQRMKELDIEASESLINSFVQDYFKYSFIKLTSNLLESASFQIEKYGNFGLRTLDAIQLASVLEVKNEIRLAISDDNLLNKFCDFEGIATKLN